jgi:Ku70/Ku80 beta-barrel domain
MILRRDLVFFLLSTIIFENETSQLELSDGEEGGSDENQGDDDNGDDEEDDTYGAAQHVVVLLDCSSSMWQKILPNPKNFIDPSKKNDAYGDDISDDDDDDEKYISPMDQALHVLYDLVRQQVRVKGTGGRGLGSTRDGFGIVLYNTKNRHQRLLAKNGYTTAAAVTTAANDDDKNNNKNNDDNDNDEFSYKREAKTTVHTLVPLAKPNIVTIKTIRACMKDVLGERDLDLEQEYAPDDDSDNNNNKTDSPLLQALLHAQTLYKEAKCVRQKMTRDMIHDDQKHVWIFTNVDAPRNSGDVPRKVMDMLRGDEFKISLWPFAKSSPTTPVPASAAAAAAASAASTTTATTTLQPPEEFRYNLFYDKIPVDIPFRKQQQQLQQQQHGGGSHKNQTLYQQQQQQQEQLRDLVRGMMSKWTKVRARFHGLPLTFPSLAAAAATTGASGNSGNSTDNDSTTPSPTRIVLDWYYMVQVHKEPTPINIHIQDGEPLQTVTQLVTETGEILVETVRGPGAAAYLRQQEVEGRDQSAKWRAGKRRLFSHVLVHGKEQVPMSVQDRVDIRHACNRQATSRHCTLIGFRKMPTTPAAASGGGGKINSSTNNTIPLTWCMGKSYLCLPTDLSGGDSKTSASSSSDNGKKKTSSKDDEANLTAFAHLHASMLRKKVWALCELLTSVKTSQSRLAAMWPLERQASPNGNDDYDEYYDEGRHPPGMLVIPLPFADELKDAPLDRTDAPMVVPDASASGLVKMEVDDNPKSANDDSDAAFQAAVDLVKKLTFQEGTELGVNFENVRLKRYWDHIECTALELPAMKETDEANETKINPEAILKRTGLEIQAFAESLPEDVKVEKAGKASKKAAKVAIDDVGDLKDYFRRLYKENALNERTMPDIKKFLKQENEGRDKANRISLAGKKQDLINRISEIFEAEQNETYGGVRVKQEDDDLEE